DTPPPPVRQSGIPPEAVDSTRLGLSWRGGVETRSHPRKNLSSRPVTATQSLTHFLRCRIRLRIRRFLRPTLRRPLPRRRLAMRAPVLARKCPGTPRFPMVGKASHHTRARGALQGAQGRSRRLIARRVGGLPHTNEGGEGQ